MRAQIALEWKLFTQNLKNRIVFGIFIFICFYGAFVLEANFEPLRPIDIEVLESEVIDAEYFLENNDPILNPRATNLFHTVMEINPVLIEAIEREDWQTVIEQEQKHYEYLIVDRYGYDDGYIDPNLYEYGEPVYLREFRQKYYDSYVINKYEDYKKENTVLSLPVLEERTTLQALLRHLQGNLPVILIATAILFSIDIFPKDKNHQTIAQNIPLSKYKNGWAKSIVILTGLTLTIFIGFIVFSIPITIKHGIGSINLPIPIYGWALNSSFSGTDGIWISNTIGIILLQAVTLLYIVFIIFIRLVNWISIYIKQSFINLLTIPLVFINQLWHKPGVTYSTDIYNYLPATYFRVGVVLTGQLNFLYLSNTITFGTGLISLGLSWIFLEVLILGSLYIKRNIK